MNFYDSGMWNGCMQMMQNGGTGSSVWLWLLSLGLAGTFGASLGVMLTLGGLLLRKRGTGLSVKASAPTYLNQPQSTI